MSIGGFLWNLNLPMLPEKLLLQRCFSDTITKGPALATFCTAEPRHSPLGPQVLTLPDWNTSSFGPANPQ